MRLLALFASALLLPCIAVPQQPWPLDAAGWTVMPTQNGGGPPLGQTIFVSKAPDGNDANDGLHPTLIAPGQGPKRTIQAGYTALDALTAATPPGRQLLLREGDTFSSPQDVISWWALSGTSTSDPMIFGSYRDGATQQRPKISVTNNSAFSAYAPTGVRYLLVTGIQFECPPPASQANGLIGIYFLGGDEGSTENEWVRFEDCEVNGWFMGIAIDPHPATSCSNISVRRCVVVDNYRVTTATPPGFVLNCTGLYAEQTNGLLVEECVFDRNGWDGVNYSTRHGQNHNIYIQDNCTEVTVIGNIAARGSGDNYQLRPIGTIHKNLSLKAPVHFFMGHDEPNTPHLPRTGEILGNVALEGDDINPPTLQLGWAYIIRNVEPHGNSIATMRYNIAAHKGPNGGGPLGIYLDARANTASQMGIRDLHVHNNVVYEWGAPLEVDTSQGSGPGISGVELYSNDIQDHQPPNVPAYAFRGPGSHAVTGWTSYGNRFWTGKSGMTFMTWVGSDYTVTGWWQRPDVFDGPEVASGLPQSIALDVLTLPVGQRYSNPGRTIVTYHQDGTPTWGPAGTGGLPEFMDRCRLQRKGNWNDKFTGLRAVQYFQDGFDLTVQ